MEGSVLKGIGGFYTVLSDGGELFTLRAQAKIRRERLKPVIGDRVEFAPGAPGEEGWLIRILPRKNELTRPSVANIDTIVVVISVMSPAPDMLLVDKMLIEARRMRVNAMLVINKRDLDERRADDIAREYANSGYETHAVCAASGEGIDALRRALSGCVHAFGGQSGVGKSSIINALYALRLETGRVSGRIERGKHTTRKSELIPVAGGGSVLDTPGFSLLATGLMPPEELQAHYPEFAPYIGKCRFAPCMHIAEPSCAVRAALDAGLVSEGRYERYIQLFTELNERWKNRYD